MSFRTGEFDAREESPRRASPLSRQEAILAAYLGVMTTARRDAKGPPSYVSDCLYEE